MYDRLLLTWSLDCCCFWSSWAHCSVLASHYMAGTLSGLDKYSAQLLKFKKDRRDSCQFKLKKDHCNKRQL